MAAPNPISKHRRNLATPEPDPIPPPTSDPVLTLKKKQYRPQQKQPPFEHPDPRNPKAPSFLMQGKLDAHSQAKSLNGSAEFDQEKLSSLVRKQPQQGKHLKKGCTQEAGKAWGKEGVDIEVKLRKKFEEWEDLGKKLKEKEKVGALVVRREELRKSCDGEVESGGLRRKATAAESLIVNGGGVGGRRRSFGSMRVELSDVFATNGARVVSVDMPPFMQIHAVDCARKTSDSMEKFSCKTLALALKKEFDGVYGPAWHCIVGTSFGSFVTHSVGGFIYFAMGQKMYILLFKTTVQRAD